MRTGEETNETELIRSENDEKRVDSGSRASLDLAKPHQSESEYQML